LRGLKGAERCQVVMHVDVNTLREQRSGVCCTHGRAHFEDKPWLSPATARRLSCDASLVTVLEDDAGKVLNVGRKSRIVPERIRRALRERDGVCQYPGCQESEYVDAHHIRHWAEGGETRLDNLVTLCRFHHRQLHRGCFDIRLNGNSAEILAPADGEGPWLPTGKSAPLRFWHRRIFRGSGCQRVEAPLNVARFFGTGAGIDGPALRPVRSQ
ncbi:MAG: HNH endonuclease signature motif containing protein, partial [Haliea sp.]